MPLLRNEFRFNGLVYFCLGALLVAVSASGEEWQPRLLVRVWRSENGLPSNRVRSVVQAADGWLWVATAEGVARFDGVRFPEFKQERDAKLAQLPARALFALPNGDVWVSTLQDGLFRWHAGHLRLVWPDDDPAKPKPSESNVDEVVSDGAGGAVIVHGADLWLAKGEAAPVRVERTSELDALLRGQGSRPRDSTGASIQLRDAQDRVWQVTGYSLVVTDSAGKVTSISLPSVEANPQIYELHEDREGNIWVATSVGLVEVCPRPVEVVSFNDGRASRGVRAVIEDRSGALWVSTRDDRGLFRRAKGTVTAFDADILEEAGREIVALCEDHSGTIWAAPNVGPVVCVDGDRLRPAPVGSLTGLSRVMAMIEDHRGRIWFGGALGLAVWDGTVVTRCAVPTQDFTALAVDATGTVWAGTRNGLIFRIRDLVIELAGSVQTSRGISGLLPDTDGTVWISTIGSGLHHLVRDRLFHFSTEQGLPDARLTCVLDDSTGRLWLGSLSGILSAGKTELAEIESGQRKTTHWWKFDHSDGMAANDCAGGPQPAGYRGRDGQLWFATANGLAQIWPDHLSKNRVQPVVEITQVSVNGREVNPSDESIQVGPGRTQLGFAYTGLSFIAPERVQFRTKLEGLEQTWQEMGNRRQIAYDSVPPGQYRFRVIAANRDGIWTEPGDSVAVEVLPLFWERRSVRAGAGLLIVATAAAAGWEIARARMKRRLARMQLQSAREAERARIARDLHDDLGSSLTHISLFANMAAEKVRIGTEVNHVLPEIAGKVQALVGTLDEIVWTVNPRYDTLASMAEYLAASAAELLSSAGIALRLEIPRDLPVAALDAERRHSLFLAAREALNNAVKHSGATEVRLHLGVTETGIEITVEDNGRGFVVECATGGEGLRNLHERLGRNGGRCVVESTPGSGTCVRFWLALPGADDVGR